MDGVPTTGSRTYGGRSAEERQAARRRQLVDAALDIWDDQGWAAVTMRGVCSAAGLTDRYFYESFADRDALLVAAWDQVRDDTVALLLGAIVDKLDRPPMAQLRAVIAELVHHLGEHRARLFFGDHAGSDVLEKRRQQTLQHFSTLLIEMARPFLRPGADENGLRMSTLIGVGGFVELVSAWRAGVVRADAEQIIEHATAVGAVLAARYVREA
jgi:AcrR family transcriptional regulator